jgi:hypothetical protein
METFLPKALDVFLRRHPLVVVLTVLVLAIVACWVLIGAGNSILVYEGF